MSIIISKTDLTAFMDKPLTAAVADRVVKAVNAYIERVTNRCWGDIVTVRETHEYRRHVWLRHQDVQQVSSVKIGGYGGTLTDIVAPAYHCSSLGRLSFHTAAYYTRHPWHIEVTYSYGVDEVPDDLKLAALGIAAGFYNWATNGQKEVSASQVGSYRVEYAGSRRSADAIDTAAQSNFAIVASYATKRS